MTDISENYQSYRGTQFNLTLCDLPIKRFLASQRNQIYSEASSTHFSAVNLWYTYALPIIILIDPNKSHTFQKTIRVIAEHNWICYCDLPIKTLLAFQRKQIYSEASLTHFSAINLSYTYSLPIIILIVPNKWQTFQKTIRIIAEHNSIWHCNLLKKTLLASQRNQIYSEASSTHFSAVNLCFNPEASSTHFSAVNLWYTYALPINPHCS